MISQTPGLESRPVVARQIRRERRRVCVIQIVAVMHLVWAMLFVYSPRTIMATPVSSITLLLGRWIGAGVLAISACMSLAYSAHQDITVLWPQQALVTISFISSLYAIFAQQYADGAHYPWFFILSDQLPCLLLSIFHTIHVAFELQRKMHASTTS